MDKTQQPEKETRDDRSCRSETWARFILHTKQAYTINEQVIVESQDAKCLAGGYKKQKNE